MESEILRRAGASLRAPAIAAIAGILTVGCGASDIQGPQETQRIAFYGGFNAYVVLPVTVTIDGTPVGTITGFYPTTPPGNCSAEYTAKAELPKDGKSRDWNARSANGLAFGGVIRAQGGDCQRIQVF